MKLISNLRPSPALVVAMTALVIALSGAALALPGKNSVTKNDIKNGAVTTKKIAKGAVGSTQIKGKSIKGNRIKDGGIKDKQIAEKTIKAKQIADATITERQIADATITGAKIADESVGSAKISDLHVQANGLTRITATAGATEAAAQAAAPESALFSKGQLSFYAKCFTDSANGDTLGVIYARTTANGSLLAGTDSLPANPGAVLLDMNTLEQDRELDTAEVVNANEAAFDGAEGSAASPDNTSLRLETTIGVKQGNLAGGNGVYGSGDVCLFGLDALG